MYAEDTLAIPPTWPSITSQATSRCSAPMDRCACSYVHIPSHTTFSTCMYTYVCTKLCRYVCSCVSVYIRSCVGVWYQRMPTWTSSAQVSKGDTIPCIEIVYGFQSFLNSTPVFIVFWHVSMCIMSLVHVKWMVINSCRAWSCRQMMAVSLHWKNVVLLCLWLTDVYCSFEVCLHMNTPLQLTL